MALLATQQDPRSTPSNAQIVEIHRDRAARCLGVALGEGWILTAKHCVVSPGALEPDAASRFRIHRPGRALPVLEILTPPLTYDHLGQLHGRDIALVRVEPDFGAETCVAVARHAASVWGVSRYARLEVVATEVKRIHGNAVFTEAVTRSGDSGGPLLDSQGCVVGVASWRTRGSGDGEVSVFTRVAAFQPWIERMMQRRGSTRLSLSGAAVPGTMGAGTGSKAQAAQDEQGVGRWDH